MFPDVFDKGLGLLEGEYHIRLNDSAKAVQYTTRRGQVALRNKIKESLEELNSVGLIGPVSKPAPWISSMLAILKTNGKIRICLGPKESYANDRGHRNWHVKLDVESSHLTAFHTAFGVGCLLV